MEISRCLLSEEAHLGEEDVKVRPAVKFIGMVNLHMTDLLFKSANLKVIVYISFYILIIFISGLQITSLEISFLNSLKKLALRRDV